MGSNAWGSKAGRLFAQFALMVCIALMGMSDSAWAKGSREKVIDFEDEVVEGLNKRPLDSLQQISDARKKNRPHLYRKRGSFRSETAETLRAVRFVQ